MELLHNIVSTSRRLLLGISLVINIPIFIHFSRTVYRDEDELAENVKQAIVDLACGEDGPPIEENHYSGSDFFWRNVLCSGMCIGDQDRVSTIHLMD